MPGEGPGERGLAEVLDQRVVQLEAVQGQPGEGAERAAAGAVAGQPGGDAESAQRGQPPAEFVGERVRAHPGDLDHQLAGRQPAVAQRGGHRLVQAW